MPPFLATKKKIAKTTRRPQERARAAVRLPAERVAVAAAHGRPPPQQAGRGPRLRYRRRRHRHRTRVHLRRVPRRARQHERRPHGPVHRVRHRPLAHGVLCAEDEVSNVSPATCSTKCHNRSVCPLGVHKARRLESKLLRYNTSCYPHSIGVVPVAVTTYVRDDCMLLEIMTEPSSAMPWPPTSNDYWLSKRIQGCFNLWTPLRCGWALVQQRAPWPPPVHFDLAACGLDVLPCSWLLDDLAIAVHKNMLKMARDEQQKLLLLDLLVLVMAAPVMTLWTMGIQQYIYQDNTIRNPHMIELEEDPNTHCNDSKGKFAVTNEFSDGHQRVEPLSQWGTNGFSSGKFRVQGNCLMLDTRPSGKRGDSNAWLFAIKGARSLSEKMLPDCGFSYRNQTDMVEKIIYFLTSLSITRPWDPGVLTSFCASQHKDNYFQQCFQIVVRLPSIWTWISDMHQFNISFVSLHALEELLLTGVHCSHLKLMESLLIVKIAGWVFDRVITCLWRVGIHDYDWLFILCFRIVYKSSALQLLLVLMPQKSNESTISLINVKYKKRLVIFSWVQPMAGVDHLRAYRWQHEPLINLITSVKLKCKVAKDLSSSSSVHWRWCDHSLIEMCQDRSAEGEELLQISIGSLWLRLEGKPHFKRRGMSRTRPLRSCCQVDQAVETEKATKGKGLGPVRGIEQNRDELVFLLRTRSSLYLLLFLNPSL